MRAIAPIVTIMLFLRSGASASEEQTDLASRLRSVDDRLTELSSRIGEISKTLQQQSSVIQRLSTQSPAPRPPSREEIIASMIGKTVPLASLSSISNDGQKSPFDLRAHEFAVLTVMRTGCHFCQQEAPDLAALDALAQSAGRAVVVPVFGPEPAAAITEFLSKYGWKQASPAVMSGGLGVSITGTPTTLIVDKSGKISRVFVGLMSPDQLAEVRKIVGVPVKEKEAGE